MLAADQRRQALAVERLEAALGTALAGHAPGGERLGEALEAQRAEIGELEEPADQPACCLAMTTPPGSARACSRAARFGVSPTTVSSRAAPCADQLADHDQPGGDADPRRERLVCGIASPPTASVSASPARTARSASSSCACGQPK